MYRNYNHPVDCKWKSFAKFTPCTSICGRGTKTWTREKSVNESNCGNCNETYGRGKQTCFGCDKIGIKLILKSYRNINELCKIFHIYIHHL